MGPVYDAMMVGLERLLLRRWRRRLWSGLEGGGRGLELGGGTGANNAYLPAGGAVVLAEPDAGMLRHALRKGLPANVRPARARAEALPFADGCFDWVAATLVFCQVAQPELGLAEAFRVLRPGGLLLLLEHVRPHGALGALAGAATRVTAPLFREHFDRRTIDLAVGAGFRVEEEERRIRGGLVLARARKPG